MLTDRFETWPEQWERQGMEKGMRKGLEEGLQQGRQQTLRQERLLLLRQARKRFGNDVAARSEPLLDRVDDPQVLEDLAEALLDSSDAAAWLQALEQAAP